MANLFSGMTIQRGNADITKCTVAEAAHLGDATAEYRRGELGLECKILRGEEGTAAAGMDSFAGTNERVRSTHFVICDTLTLTLNADDGSLLEFDSYTNSSYWIHDDTLAPPATASSGILRLTPGTDDDRTTLAGRPEYRVNDNLKLLQIKLPGRGPAVHFVRLSSNLYAGMDANSHLCELLCAGVTYQD